MYKTADLQWLTEFKNSIRFTLDQDPQRHSYLAFLCPTVSWIRGISNSSGKTKTKPEVGEKVLKKCICVSGLKRRKRTDNDSM